MKIRVTFEYDAWRLDADGSVTKNELIQCAFDDVQKPALYHYQENILRDMVDLRENTDLTLQKIYEKSLEVNKKQVKSIVDCQIIDVEIV